MSTNAHNTSNLLRFRLWRAPRRGNHKERRPHFWRALLVLALLGVAVVGTAAFFGAQSVNVIAPGVSIASLDVGRLPADEAERQLREIVARHELVFVGLSRTVRLPLAKTDSRPALAELDTARAVREALAVGREANPALAAASRLRAYLFGYQVDVPVVLRQSALTTELKSSYADAYQPAQNAGIDVTFGGSQPLVKIRPAVGGTVIDLDRVLRETETALANLTSEPVGIRLVTDRPQIEAEDVEPLLAQVAPALRRAPLQLTTGKRNWNVSQRTLSEWLQPLQIDGEDGREVGLGINDLALADFLSADIGSLSVPAKDAIFEMKDGRVVRFEPSKDGSTVDVGATAALIADYVFGDGGSLGQPIELSYRSVAPKISTSAANSYGIREIIGIGESNFKGSPQNRRVNIRVGAESLNGRLVMPGEEFSTIQTLLPIDGERGYLQELVIKGNKTTPEYGGGLCQIGTTMFRTVLDSGLPVTERRNHSYRVSYYERAGDGSYMGPGKDATIYDPAPDMKFRNDTPGAILIMTAISGDRLTFTLWGTKDGRVANQTEARVWNTVAPPLKQMIETADLAPGVIKCTESPHAGADASFTYSVTYPDGNEIKKEFFSRYRPWGEVCLIGVDPAALPPVESEESVETQ